MDINGKDLNKIHNNDCVQFMRENIGDCSIDLTVTSPPYDDLRNYNGYSFNFEETAKELYRVTKEGGVVVWVVGDKTHNGSESGTSFKQALYFKEIGFNLHDTMIYEKDSISFPDKNRYYQIFEYMFVFSKGKPKTVNLISDRKNKWYNGKKHIKGHYRKMDGEKVRHNKQNLLKEFGVRFNIWRIPNGHQKSTLDKVAFEHPAIFPERLAEDHILSWSNEGDIVLDPFMGSGTTAKMAALNNRKYIGTEISKEYCDIANERLRGYRGYIGTK
ncbi:DNA-methyltransferase [Bacillus subtilis]|uniref:DNA-methyltransferase n=1 Tax=Bacillus subtilis TaxID=1423 RepID=UPI001ABD122D|nr:site-specific DNA-methyltransferase [Bacillus subtilis]MBO3635177.1 site-specific DNA-methyltransferase [Bacillus subtilis]MCF7606531.1 site-specific DNA-methyltransferase [Bacillus subtilis]MCF7613010.1 site-specific DNA-methyltransferase [Bacillus subtilis]